MERHYGLDWLRIGAFALLILYHVGMFFVPWPWHVKTNEPVVWATIPMLATNSWRLLLLFVVSGYATRAIMQRANSLPALAGERSKRLLIPLAFGMIVIIPPQPWVELMAQHGLRQDYLGFWLRDYFDLKSINGVVVPTWNHLWFVAYLWVYTLVLLALVALCRRLRWDGQAGFERLMASGPRLLLIPTAWLLLAWLAIFPGERLTNGLIDDPLGHAVFGVGFVFGFALGGAPAALEAAARSWKAAALIYAFAYGVVIAFDLHWPGNIPVPDEYRPVFKGARVVQGWSAVVALLGLAHRYWNRDHPWRARLTEAVFPFYIVHQTIIVVVGWWLLQWTLPTALEFPLLLAATIAGCWLFYAVGLRVSLLRPLIGLKANVIRKVRPTPDAAG